MEDRQHRSAVLPELLAVEPLAEPVPNRLAAGMTAADMLAEPVAHTQAVAQAEHSPAEVP